MIETTFVCSLISGAMFRLKSSCEEMSGRLFGYRREARWVRRATSDPHLGYYSPCCVPHACDVEAPQPKSQEPGYAGMCEPAVPSSARQGSCRWEIEGIDGSVISIAGEGCTWAYISTKGVPMSFTTFGRRFAQIGNCLVSTPLFSFSFWVSIVGPDPS